MIFIYRIFEPAGIIMGATVGMGCTVCGSARLFHLTFVEGV